MLEITDAAKEMIHEFMQAEEKTDRLLRIDVTPKGPRRFHYELNLVERDDQDENDQVIDYGGGLEVVIDARSAELTENAVMDFVRRGLESGFKFDNPLTEWIDPIAQAVQKVIDEQINPAVASHGGFVELLDVKDERAYVRLGGGCQGCGMAGATLKQGVEVQIKEAVPQIVAVLDTTDHAAGANPYYQGGHHQGGQDADSVF